MLSQVGLRQAFIRPQGPAFAGAASGPWSLCGAHRCNASAARLPPRGSSLSTVTSRVPAALPAVAKQAAPSLPRGYGLARNVEKKLNMYMIINGTKCLGGSAACGDFPDSPEDGWATARAYREHVLRVVARLREDPGAEVEVAEVKARIDEKGSRLRPWTPGDESVRPSVLAAVRAALGAVEQPGQNRTKHGLPAGLGFSRMRALTLQICIKGTQVLVGYAGSGDFPDSPEDDWATARAYREHMERVVARLREDPGAAVEVAEVGGRGRRLQPWAPGDESVRPKVLAAIRAALAVKTSGIRGRQRTQTDLPPGSGLYRMPNLVYTKYFHGKNVALGSAASGDFPDSPEDGWATARAYREHMERVVARLREDPGADVEAAEVGKHGRRLQPWAPRDESVRPKVLAAIRAALSEGARRQG